MSKVTLKDVHKAYGSTVALKRVSLDVNEGELVTLLGPSGCGKTTTLRLIAGFIEPTDGQILIGEEDVTHLPPFRRGLGMVFQDYALFPHMTVHDNIGFGLKERGAPKAKIAERVGELLNLIQLPGIAARYPSELSGGQAQRVAFARAIAHPPRVLLMDEPLAALDLKLRESMQIELRRLQQELRITTVFVTHDQTEAMTMSDRIAVMNQGGIEQIGTPEEIYARPATRFVAGFVGQINLVEGVVLAARGGIATVKAPNGAVILVATEAEIAVGGNCLIAIRPERMSLVGGTAPSRRNEIAGRIVQRIFSGSIVKLIVDAGSGLMLSVEGRISEVSGLSPGDDVKLGFDPGEAILLEPGASGALVH